MFRRPDPLLCALSLMAALTAVRVAALFGTPLELYPDEAQYWLWSREIDWGYYSKPPMVAWLIAASTALGGDDEAWIRLPAALVHAGAALALYAAGRRLYGSWTGFWAAALYSLMPGVQLSAGVMTTDAPMLLFLSLSVWAYAGLLQAETRRAALTAAGSLGAALGLAVLSKYAAFYFIAGLLLHTGVAASARRRWAPSALIIALAGFLLVLAPNLIWNATHGFATVAHTADNAQWSGADLFNPFALAEFAAGQFVVFGPLPFLVLAAGVGLVLARTRLRRGLPPADLALLCLTLPPLLIVAGQAFISRANANWAVAAYASGSVLVAAWLVRNAGSAWARLGLGGAVLSQGVTALLFLAAVLSPAVVSSLGLDNAAKRLRGWEATTAAITEQAASAPWTAITTDDRFMFNALAYYGRDFWSRPGAPPLRMWVREVAPQNQAETQAPLTPAEAGRVLHASLTSAYAAETGGDFASWRPVGRVSVRLDGKRTRDTMLFEARGWARAPRDPLSGRPYARPTAP